MENKKLEHSLDSLDWTNKQILSNYKIKIDSINKVIKLDSIRFEAEKEKIKDLTAKEVKKEILKDVKIIDEDSSEVVQFTLNEIKAVLMENRGLNFALKREGLENAKLSANNSALEKVNINLNEVISIKDAQLENSDELLRLTKKKHRNNLLKVGGVCIGVGVLVGAIFIN